MYVPLCGTGWTLCILVLPRGVPIPQQPRQDRRDRVYPPLCWSGWALCIPRSPTGRPYPPRGRGTTGGTRVYPLLCGSGWPLCILVLPRAIPISQAAQAGPGGLGCIRRSVVMAGLYAYLFLPRGVPIHQAAQAGPGGPGCIRRCVGVAVPCVSSFSHEASLSPKRPRQDRRDSGVSATVWEWLDLVYARSPTGRPYPPSGPSRTGGTQVYPPLCGSGYTLCILRSPTGHPYRTSGLGRTGGTRVYPPLCGSGWTLCMLVLPRGVPIPQAAQAGPEGLRCIRRCMGVVALCTSSFSHGASLSPKRPRQDRGHSGVSAAA